MEMLVVATNNHNKLEEIKTILSGFDVEVLSMKQVGINKEIDETGTTFEENAVIKANAIFKICRNAVIADDSGLEIDYLDGEPGIRSARFMGPNISALEKNLKILELLKNVPFADRSARFVCAIAVVSFRGYSFTVKGVCEGYISDQIRGKGGFGYDPIFFVPKYNMTTAEMSSTQKNQISHRGKALRLMVDRLSTIKE